MRSGTTSEAKPSVEDLVDQWVRGQVAGWKQSRLGYMGAPSLDDVPLHVYGNLSTRQIPGSTVYCIGHHDLEESSIVPWKSGETFPRPNYSFVPESADKRYPFRGRLRELQSWYREYVLALEPGLDRSEGREVHSRLPHEAVQDEPTLNFLLNSDIEAAARQRLGTKGWGGIINPDRLYRDLLSSQPLCFNLFGFLAVEERAGSGRTDSALYLMF